MTTTQHFTATSLDEQMSKAARDKNIWLVGGGDLVGQFVFLTYRVQTQPMAGSRE